MNKIEIKNTSQDDTKRLIIDVNGDTKGFKVSLDVLKNTAKKLSDIFAEDLK